MARNRPNMNKETAPHSESDSEVIRTMFSRAAEDWLVSRLCHEGVDIYVDRKFDSFRDRLAYAIVRYRIQDTRAGRRNREPETFGTVFERIYSVTVEDCTQQTATNEGRYARRRRKA